MEFQIRAVNRPFAIAVQHPQLHEGQPKQAKVQRKAKTPKKDTRIAEKSAVPLMKTKSQRSIWKDNEGQQHYFL